MNIQDKIGFVIYRFAEKGLEVFMYKDHHSPEDTLSQRTVRTIDSPIKRDDDLIELEQKIGRGGNPVKVIALEADWHDLPSLKDKIEGDVNIVKSKIKELSTDFEKGTYLGIKEAFKKVMPDEYALLKELKDILLDRNSVKNI